QVEEGEDVAGDDARHRAARGLLDGAKLAQPLRLFCVRKPAGVPLVAHRRIFSEAPTRLRQPANANRRSRLPARAGGAWLRGPPRTVPRPRARARGPCSARADAPPAGRGRSSVRTSCPL